MTASWPTITLCSSLSSCDFTAVNLPMNSFSLPMGRDDGELDGVAAVDKVALLRAGLQQVIPPGWSQVEANRSLRRGEPTVDQLLDEPLGLFRGVVATMDVTQDQRALEDRRVQVGE